MAGPYTLARCPECTADTAHESVRHCGSRTCGWRRCQCGTLISDYGMWTRPQGPGAAAVLDLEL